MFRRERRPLAMAPLVPLPTGNVSVLAAPPASVLAALPAPRQGQDGVAPNGALSADGDEPTGWTIRSAAGQLLSNGLPTRATASRMLGVLASHGAQLPLIVYGPDQRPTGERLG